MEQGTTNALIGAGATLGGSAISSLAGMSSARDANAANAKMNEEMMLFNSREAQLNRDFQERMSSTQYQRAVADLKNAGLNPMLAYTNGGNASPSGSSASAGSMQRQEAVTPPQLGAMFSSAIEAMRNIMAIRKLEADVKNTESDTILKGLQAPNIERDTYKVLMEALESNARRKSIISEIPGKTARSWLESNAADFSRQYPKTMGFIDAVINRLNPVASAVSSLSSLSNAYQNYKKAPNPQTGIGRYRR